jgi:hypothetical protein
MIFINSFDCILKETHINEVELVMRFIFILSSFVMSNTLNLSENNNQNNFLQFYNLNVRLKNIFELISRLFLYLAETNLIPDISVPLFIILGRPRESYITSDHLLFQTNYLKLKPNFDKLYENWFMEALNFHKSKNMILFLKFMRYLCVLGVITFFNLSGEIKKLLSYLVELKFNKMIYGFLGVAYKNGMNVSYSSNDGLNYFHVPILISMLMANIFLTKDCLKIFAVHFIIGGVVWLLSENTREENGKLGERNKKRQNNQNNLSVNNPIQNRSLNNIVINENVEQNNVNNFNGINNN